MMLERIELSGDLLTCVEKSASGRCIKFIQTCDGDDCITESPAHPLVPGRKKQKAKRRAGKKIAKTRSPSPGKKQPWQLTKIQWETAVDATHPGTAFTSKATKGSGAELDRKLTEHLRLNYDAGIHDQGSGQVITNHKLVIAKAFTEGKSIPKSVLSEYPDIAKFVKSPGYKRDRKTLVESIEEDAKSKRKFESEKKLLQIDMVYDTDLETAIERVRELKPTVSYYLRMKSPRRTYVDSAMPFKGQSYVEVGKNWEVRRFNAEHKQIEHTELAQNDRIYEHDILTTAEIINELPADRKRRAIYYLTKLSDNRTKVEPKTPGGTGPYIRVDYRGIAHFDADRKLVQKKGQAESGTPLTQPPNAAKWEVLNPPRLLDPAKMKKKRAIGEYTYLVGNRTKRKSDPSAVLETDYQAVTGSPISAPGLEMLQLFAHKTLAGKGITISEVTTGMSVAHGDNKDKALDRLADVAKIVQSDPELAMSKIKGTRKIADYPHLEIPYKRIFSQLPLPDPQISGLGDLAGDLLTCNKWKILGGPGNEYIRCEEYKRTCQPGDANCIEPERAQRPDKKEKAELKTAKVKDSAKDERRGLQDRVLMAIGGSRLTLEQIAKKTSLDTRVVEEIRNELIANGDLLAYQENYTDYNFLKPQGRKRIATEAYGPFWFNVVKGGTKIRRIPVDAVGTDFGAFLDADQGRAYMVFAYGADAAEKELTENLKRISEFRKEHGQGFISDKPTKQILKRPGEPVLTYHVQPVTDYESYADFLKNANVKDLVNSRLMLEPSGAVATKQKAAKSSMSPEIDLMMFNYLSSEALKYEDPERFAKLWGDKAFSKHGLMILEEDRVVLDKAQKKGRRKFTSTEQATMNRYEMDSPDEMWEASKIIQDHTGRSMADFWRLVAPAKEVEPPKPTPAEPEQIWMKEKPFTKRDTEDYNRYTFYPVNDVNTEFQEHIKPKLQEVDRLMKEYDVSEIPAEVQTALMWYRRRTYEYIQRKIYSRNNAPGAMIVGPSKYNYRKHDKVIAGDKKYWDNLETSGRKLETAIKKTITRGTKEKPAVSVKERDKWQETAVKTKRTKFGKIVLENQIAYNKANPDKAPKSIDLSDPKSTFRSVVRQEGRNVHARMILDAHQRGIEINPEVLAEYPALTADLAGIGTMLQAANALYSLAKIAI